MDAFKFVFELGVPQVVSWILASLILGWPGNRITIEVGNGRLLHVLRKKLFIGGGKCLVGMFRCITSH